MRRQRCPPYRLRPTKAAGQSRSGREKEHRPAEVSVGEARGGVCRPIADYPRRHSPCRDGRRSVRGNPGPRGRASGLPPSVAAWLRLPWRVPLPESLQATWHGRRRIHECGLSLQNGVGIPKHEKSKASSRRELLRGWSRSVLRLRCWAYVIGVDRISVLRRDRLRLLFRHCKSGARWQMSSPLSSGKSVLRAGSIRICSRCRRR